MQTRSTHAGGFLLVIGIFAGIAGGIAAGELMLGTVIGLAVGIGLAVTVWLVDRRRG
jgi:uncharacterized membrane protein YccC